MIKGIVSYVGIAVFILLVGISVQALYFVGRGFYRLYTRGRGKSE